jgi:uncharacterized protein YndB with AHSA1/START domain
MRIEKTVKLKAQPDEVWEALTNPEITKQYFYGCEAISEWQVGSPLIFKFKSDEHETIPVKGVVKVVEPSTYLEHTCFDSDFENDPAKHTIVTYSLLPDGDKTKLTVTQGEFPDDEDMGQHDASWSHVLDGLKALLENATSN